VRSAQENLASMSLGGQEPSEIIKGIVGNDPVRPSVVKDSMKDVEENSKKDQTIDNTITNKSLSKSGSSYNL